MSEPREFYLHAETAKLVEASKKRKEHAAKFPGMFLHLIEKSAVAELEAAVEHQAEITRDMADSHIELEAENKKLREAIEAALRIRDLWSAPDHFIHGERTSDESAMDEFKALASMEGKFNEALSTGNVQSSTEIVDAILCCPNCLERHYDEGECTIDHELAGSDALRTGLHPGRAGRRDFPGRRIQQQRVTQHGTKPLVRPHRIPDDVGSRTLGAGETDHFRVAAGGVAVRRQ